MNWKEALLLLQKLDDPGESFQEMAKTQRQLIASAKHFERELSDLLLTECDDSFRIAILNIMGNSRHPYFEAEIKRLLDSNQSMEVLQTAATNLGRLSSKGSFEILIELLKHPHPNVRLGAIYGLVALADKRAVKYLEALVHDGASAKAWWPGPKAGGYRIAEEAARAIVQLADAA